MRKVREVTASEENFRVANVGGLGVIRRDPVEPEPVGTLLLVPVRIVGYDPDCDGSLMARYEIIGLDDAGCTADPEILGLSREECRSYGISTNHGLHPDSGFVVTAEEIAAMADRLESK